MKDDYILIVDDELPIREMIHTSLDMAGFQCLQAEDAKQAHQIIVDQRPALILLDWMLPGGVSGVDLCRRLKRDENLAEIPVTAAQHFFKCLVGIVEGKAQITDFALCL